MTRRSLTTYKKEFLAPRNALQIYNLWCFWYQQRRGRAYKPWNRTHELALIKAELGRHEAYQLAYTIVQNLDDWSEPTVRAFLQWLGEGGGDDEVFNDPLQAQAYFIWTVTRDETLMAALQHYDEADAALSWGHSVDLRGARQRLQEACEELLR